jgi:hypothetical protein
MRTTCLGHAMGMLAAALFLLTGPAFAADGPGHMALPPTAKMEKSDAALPPASEPPATGTATTPTAPRQEEIQKLLTFPKYDEKAWAEIVEKGRALLVDVKDNTFGYDEAAFYWLVGHVNRTAPDLFTPGPEDKEVPFKILLAQPETTRGEVVTIKGAYLNVYPFHVTVSGLRKDVPMLYECIIGELPLTNDSTLATVITTEDPMEYLSRNDEVVVKGYFYKLRTYQRESDNSQRPSPMIVTRRLEPVDPNANRGMFSSVMADPWMIPAFGVMLLLVGGFIFLKMVTKPKPKHERDKAPTTVHKFHLRRTNFPPPPAGGGPGGSVDGPKP